MSDPFTCKHYHEDTCPYYKECPFWGDDVDCDAFFYQFDVVDDNKKNHSSSL